MITTDATERFRSTQHRVLNTTCLQLVGKGEYHDEIIGFGIAIISLSTLSLMTQRYLLAQEVSKTVTYYL